MRFCTAECRKPPLVKAIGNFPARELLKQWLKAGYMKEDMWHATDAGVPQGGVITPPTKLQTFFFRVGHLRMWIDPKDDIHLLRGHFDPLHQGTDQFAFACPVCLL